VCAAADGIANGSANATDAGADACGDHGGILC
jgi:hypothetical protein